VATGAGMDMVLVLFGVATVVCVFDPAEMKERRGGHK
jgi:hypothetical protein